MNRESAFVPLTIEELEGLANRGKEGYPPLPQVGPLRMYDVEMLCVVSGYYEIDPVTYERTWKKTHGACRSPTYYKVEGLPMCGIHALMKLNELLVERGVE